MKKIMRVENVGKMIERDEIEENEEEEKGERIKELRMKEIMEKIYEKGLRVQEIVGMKVKVERKEKRFLMVRGKGQKDRMVKI